jgi:hypothetical protein
MTDYRAGATYAPGPTQTAGEGTAEQIKEQARQTTQVARQKTRSAAAQARDRFRDQVDQRSTQAGERIGGTAQDVRGVADELRRQDKEAPARIAEQVADQADRLGDYLKSASGDRILGDVERVTRDNPWLVAGGGLVLGFAASRFLKASSSRRYHSRTSTSRVALDPDSGAPTTTSVPRYPEPPPVEPVPPAAYPVDPAYPVEAPRRDPLG